MAKLRGVIFDYGSTLITFEGDLAEVRALAHHALYNVLRKDGVELRESSFLDRLARKFDENDRQRLVDHIESTATAVLVETFRAEGVPPQPLERIQRALRAMYAVYESHWKLFPETHAALRKVRALGLRMAMLSNSADADNVRRMLAGHRLENYFDPVVVSAAIGVRKPDERAFQPVLKSWGIPAREIAMVGDQLGMDILGAKALGMRTIWLCTEEQSPTNRPFLGKVSADAQVKTIGEVAAILAHWKATAKK
jgi:HAD superfamily hydrolase (TIGR01662 family)